jgi:periplasmic copper chaperone A
MNRRVTKTVATAGALSLALAAPAAAHITPNPGTGASDGYTTQSFQVPHGCEEAPTTQIRIQIPASVPTATPAVHPLWTVKTKEGKKNPVEMHGEKITSGVAEVIYTAKRPLPPDRLDSFPISLKLPAGKEGETIYFPTIQKCTESETRWIQVPAEGESADELEEPAPGVVLTAAEGEHGSSGGSQGGDKGAEEHAASTENASVQTAGAAVEDDSAPTWLTVAALVIGALGLVAGVAGLTAARRRSA